MVKQTIGLGAAANDGTGDTLRVAGDKINDNFDELYLAAESGGLSIPRVKASGKITVAAGVPSLVTGVNVASVTKTATGRFRVTFTTALPSTNFGVNASVIFGAFNDDWTPVIGIDRHVGSGFATSHIDFICASANADTNVYDPASFTFEIFDLSANANGAQSYRYGSFAPSAITASEILLDHIVAAAHNLDDDFAGCVASVGTNPAASWVASIQKNGAAVGTLTISTAGVVTFATTGTTVAMAVGDVLTMIAPAAADASIARLRFTFQGV